MLQIQTMEKILTNTKFHLIIFSTILICCIFLLLGRLVMTGSAIGGDAVYYYSALRSLGIDHDLDFKNEYQFFHESTSGFTGNKKIPIIPDANSTTQKLPTKYPIGSALFLLPTFLLTNLLLNGDGYNIFYQAISALSSLSYAFCGLLLIYFLGKEIFNSKVAFLGTLGIWLATPLVYYMTMEPLNSQPLSFFSVSLFIYLWFKSRVKGDLKHWIVLGIVGGLMSMVRPQDSLFLLIPIIDAFILKTNFLYILIFLFSSSIIMLPQFWANNYLFGSPFINSYNGIGFPYLTSPWIFYSLFSPERGLLFWSPILIFALIGLYWFFKKSKLIGSLLLFSFLIQLYIVSSWADPTQGDSFGNRILLNCNPIFVIGLIQFLEKAKKYQNIIMLSLLGLISLNGTLIVLFIFRFIGQPY